MDAVRVRSSPCDLLFWMFFLFGICVLHCFVVFVWIVVCFSGFHCFLFELVWKMEACPSSYGRFKLSVFLICFRYDARPWQRTFLRQPKAAKHAWETATRQPILSRNPPAETFKMAEVFGRSRFKLLGACWSTGWSKKEARTSKACHVFSSQLCLLFELRLGFENLQCWSVNVLEMFWIVFELVWFVFVC